jgi:HEPN domain-containing protein
MPLDPVLLRHVEAWLLRASRDLDAGENDLQGLHVLPEDVLFHSQQAVEKTLKALLLLNGIEPPRKHDIAALAEPLLAVMPGIVSWLEVIAPLSDYAWKYRYPFDELPPDAEHAQETLAQARRFYDWACGELSKGSS